MTAGRTPSDILVTGRFPNTAGVAGSGASSPRSVRARRAEKAAAPASDPRIHRICINHMDESFHNLT